MNKLTTKAELHDQVKHLDRLIDRIENTMGLSHTKGEAGLYAGVLRGLLTYTRGSVAMKTVEDAQKEIDAFRAFLDCKVVEFENDLRVKLAEAEAYMCCGIRTPHVHLHEGLSQ